MQTLDLLANNLANAATAGFKRDQEFYGLFASQDSDDGTGTAPSATLPVLQRQWTDFSPGTVEVTGNPMNVALNGSGFFAVNGPNGPLYTRNGSLQVLASGDLATADGYPLQAAGGGTIKVASGKAITITDDGTVKQNGQTLGRLNVVTFPNTSALQKFAGTCFQNPDPKNTAAPVAAPNVQQGKIEASNVPVAEAAMRLVGVMRQFEMLQKAITMSGEMDTKSIQEVARVGA
jgi:flagellar basal-body rod protein FlgG